MAKPASSTFSDQTATVRNLKRLVVLLVASNIALGVFSFYVLRSVDKRYSELMGHSVPVMNDLQELTAHSVEAMRGTGPTLLNAPAEKQPQLLERSRFAIKRDLDFRNRLLKGDWLSSRPDGKVAFQKAGDAFTDDASEALRLFTSGKAAESVRFRDETLRPVFDRYLTAITRVADLLEAESERTNSDYSAKNHSLSTIMLGLAGWPLLALAALLLLVAVLVIAMMIAFRGKDLADTP